MGYAGGKKVDPSYHDLGDHTEVVRVTFDPREIEYERLLEVFWAAHNPLIPAWSQQYASLILVADEEQRQLAQESLESMQKEYQGEIQTRIVPAEPFYLAEAYHQKYYLRQKDELANIYTQIYPDLEDLVSSTAATRVNAYLAGKGNLAQLEDELPSLGLPSAEAKQLEEIVTAYE